MTARFEAVTPRRVKPLPDSGYVITEDQEYGLRNVRDAMNALATMIDEGRQEALHDAAMSAFLRTFALAVDGAGAKDVYVHLKAADIN